MYRRSNLNSLRDTSLKPRWLQSSERSSWFTPTHKLFRSCSGKEGVLWSCKVRLPLWNQQHGPLLGVFLHLILIKRLNIAKLVHISTHARTFFFEDAHLYLWSEGFWQSTWKLITHCLQQLLNPDKCLKQRNYISRSCPPLDEEGTFS